MNSSTTQRSRTCRYFANTNRKHGIEPNILPISSGGALGYFSLSSRSLVFTLGLLLLGTGCTSPYRALSLDREDPARRHANVVSNQASGLRLAATLLAENTTSSEYFHHPLIAKNIVPVLLHIENTGERMVSLQRSKVHLLLTDGESTRLSAMPPRELVERCLRSQLLSYIGAPLILPLLFRYPETEQFNFDLATDYVTKCLKPKTRVWPEDQPFSRALYFEFTPEQLEFLSRKPTLEIRVEYGDHNNKGTFKPGGKATLTIGLE